MRIVFLVAMLVLGARPVAAALELAEDDRVMVVGNEFAEKMAQSGYFEALAHAAHPDHRLVIRQAPWSGDEVGLRPREMEVPTMEDLLAEHETDVILLCFGMSESFAGLDGLVDFDNSLHRFLDDLREEHLDAQVVLVSPIAHEGLGAPWPTGDTAAERTSVVLAYAAVMRRVAESRDLTFVDLSTVSAALVAPLTSNGIHPTEYGCFVYAQEMGRQLGWLSDTGGTGDAARLRALAADKHWQFRMLYRPTNTEYVFGRRHEPYGVVNFPPEREQIRRMIDARDRAMWDMDKPSPAALFAEAPASDVTMWERVPLRETFPEDEWEPAPVEAKGRENSLGSIDIKDPDEFARVLDPADGYLVECFASEQVFAELANPLAMTFDARGRLWVLCTPTYPHLLPGERPRCMLLIIEDTDGDGRADERTVFADELYIPTGFVIDVDAVYVGQAPDLLKLTDVDGDDVADRREIVLSGFGMPDSHHTISAFEWDPNGGFMMHEGVFTKSNVETPYGTRRASDAIAWRFDPRTQRLDGLSHCYYANPWGHAFDDWGQSVLADASGGDNFCFARVITAFDYPRKPRRNGPFLNRGRPTAGCEIVSSRHFPDDVQGSFLVNQSIGFHGTRWDRLIPDGSGWRAERMPWDMLTSTDVNFRPVAMEIGPDGALYIVDWCNPIIGHMQYNVRDPRRDHTHGRIWRIRHASRPLLDPPNIVDASVPELLELLRLPERNTRQHARRRLQRAPAGEVFPALDAWLAALDENDPLHDRLVLEALWIHQAHGRVDESMLDRVLALDDPRARAGGVRVLRHWMQAGEIEDATDRLARHVTDPDMRVRLEVVVACGFAGADGAEIASLVVELPTDAGVRTALEETLVHLERYGVRTDVARRLRLERVPTEKLLEEPLDDFTARALLSRADAPMEKREAALRLLAGEDEAAAVQRLYDELSDAWRPDPALRAMGAQLLEMSPEAIEVIEPRLAGESIIAPRDRRQLAIALLIKNGMAYTEPVGTDRALVPGALAWLEPGDAPDKLVAAMRDDVERGDVEAALAVPEIVRQTADRDALFIWLAAQVDQVGDDGLERWSGQHATAMAALHGMHQVEESSWPEGFEAYRAETPAPETIEIGRRVFHDTARGCARCHGDDGRGMPGFPPLDGSPWVLGRAERAAGIVVHGLVGRLRLPDGTTYESAMAPLGANLSDEEIAAVLTYVRRNWGNFADPVTPAQVARRGITPRTGLWQVAALETTYPLSNDRVLMATAPPPFRPVFTGVPARTFLFATAMFAVPAVALIALLALVFRAPNAG